jgi:catechol 2,3-dioxygenase-like lactoylglutathione lyase family enzyme
VGGLGHRPDGPRAPCEHVGFRAPDRAAVDAFWRAGIDAGHPHDGAPGERAVYHPGYYGAFVLDPDGHNVEVVNHNR